MLCDAIVAIVVEGVGAAVAVIVVVVAACCA
jgi:hypothetical protein